MAITIKQPSLQCRALKSQGFLASVISQRGEARCKGMGEVRLNQDSLKDFIRSG